MIFNFPSTEEPIKRLSGDQKGNIASCVPSRRRGAMLHLGQRAQRKPPAEKTSFVPSGETAIGPGRVAGEVEPRLVRRVDRRAHDLRLVTRICRSRQCR